MFWLSSLLDLYSFRTSFLFGQMSLLADREDDKWWLLPTILVLFKSIQARAVNWHIANLEVEDFSLYCPDPDTFWAHESSS